MFAVSYNVDRTGTEYIGSVDDQERVLIRTFFGLILLPFAVSAGATALIKRLAPRLDLVDHPDKRKAHEAVTPLGGGLAIFFAVVVTLAAALAAARILHAGGKLPNVPSFVQAHVEGILSKARDIAFILGAGAVLVVVGLIDDKRGLSSPVKLGAQIIVAVSVVAWGTRATAFIGDNVFSWALTVFWIVGITNAFNLLDNMDGLSGVVGAIICAILITIALQSAPSQIFIAAILAVLLGALLGFLVFNLPPASIFMGDCGSLFVGFLLAVITIRFNFIWQGLPASKQLIPLVVPLLVFAVPIYDTASVVLIRISEGRHPFEADRKHFSHRLVDLGMSTRGALLTIYLVTFAVGISSTLLYSVEIPGSAVIMCQACAVLAVIILLEYAGFRRGSK